MIYGILSEVFSTVGMLSGGLDIITIYRGRTNVKDVF
jgi:hypothetical protein